MKIIDTMRERPDDEKIAFSVMAAGIVAIILFLFWGTTFFRQGTKNPILGTNAVKGQTAAVGEVVIKEQGKDLKKVVSDFSQQYTQIQQILRNGPATIAPLSIPQKSVVEVTVDKSGNVKLNTVMIGPIESAQIKQK